MNISTKSRPFFLFLSGIILSILFFLLVFAIKSYNHPDQIAKRFENNFRDQQSILREIMPEVISILEGEQDAYWPKLERLLNKNKIYTLIYQNDSLLFWNNNRIPNHFNALETSNNEAVLFIQTGWYLTDYRVFDNFDIHLFKEIKSEYSVTNSYLPTAFNGEFSNYENIELTLDTVHTQNIIRNKNENAVLGITIQEPINISKSFIFLLFSFFAIIYGVFLSWIYSLYLRYGSKFKHPFLLYLLFVFDVIILRSLDYFLGFPDILKNSFLFESQGIGFPGFGSTGDIVLNALLLLFLAVKLLDFMKRGQALNIQENRKRKSIISILFAWVFSFALFFLMFHIVEQSDYSAYFGMLFESFGGIANLFAVVVFISVLFITMLALSPHLVVPKPVLYTILVAVFVLLFVVYFSEFDFLNEITRFSFLVSTVFLFLILAVFSLGKGQLKISTEKYLLLMVIFSATAAIVVNRAEKRVRDDHQIKAVAYLGQTHQDDLESAYGLIQQAIRTDSLVRKIVFSEDVNPEEELTNYLKEKYFSGFWEKYTLQLTICGTEEELEIQPENVLINCNDYFSGLKSDFGEETLVPDLILLHADPESIYYLGVLEFAENSDTVSTHRVYLEFFYTIVPKGLGYPELLVDQNLSEVDLTAYSFARYENNKLVYKFGGFAYHTDFRYLSDFPEHSFFSFLNYTHYKTEVSAGNFLVVSRPKVLLTERIATFSILFLVFSLILFVRILFVFIRQNENHFNFNFQTRLQSIFTGSIAFIILLLAVITMYYARNNREKNLTDQLNEKTYSVLIELQHKLGGDGNLKDYDAETLFHLLRKFSLVFFSDINLYNSSGQLIASSRPEIFEKGLLSENINPQAFEELFVDDKLFYLTEEKIGTLAYYSSYVPLILNENKPSGIINLPYFARQNEVKQSYYQMLFTFVNLFVILGIFGIFIALILSKVLTRPLQVLQKSLANIRIDKQNEKLNWSKNDEIGKLIEEYNRMIDKLEESAELLKHSERESAWREVARQIAHEIKNPLTPMKLNVQYLEKAYREEDTDFDTKIKSISASLIEQIESLNNVAEMFADFSKSTTQNLEEVDLLAIIRSSVELFKNNRAVKIVVSSQNKQVNTWASAEGKDILRVFNNLIKNSIQSISKKVDGKIDISVQTQQSWHIVRITDNGKGMDAATKNLIFQPYFTTKSGGTGLGLAIVKSIMNGVGGEIEFESERGEGSVFTLKFKVAQHQITDNN